MRTITEARASTRPGPLMFVALLVLRYTLKQAGHELAVVTARGKAVVGRLPPPVSEPPVPGAAYSATLDTAADLQAALRRYGRHLATCETLANNDRPCSCGFAQALREGRVR